VKWRLKSDGFGVLYTDNIASVKALTIQNNVQIVIVNVLIYRDLKNVIAVNGIKGNFVLIAFTGNNAGLKKQMFDLGVRRTFSKPIDFPKLSLMVRDELKKTGRDRVTQSMKKHDTASLGLSRAYDYRLQGDNCLCKSVYGAVASDE